MPLSVKLLAFLIVLLLYRLGIPMLYDLALATPAQKPSATQSNGLRLSSDLMARRMSEYAHIFAA